MTTSPDSPTIVNDYPAQQQNLSQNKLTPKIDKAIMKIQAANTDSTRIDNLQVVFLDNSTTKTEKDAKSKKEELVAIEIERERIQRQQANIITIIPVEPSTNIHPEQSPKEPAPQQKDTPKVDPVAILSITSSTTSKEHRTPPKSPDLDDISDLNSENL